MNSPETVFPQSVLLDDEPDAPLAVGGQAPAAARATPKKKGGMPGWVFLAIGGFVLVVVVGVLAVSLLGKKRPAPEAVVVPEPITQPAPQPSPAPVMPPVPAPQAAAPAASMLGIGAPDTSASMMSGLAAAAVQAPTAAPGGAATGVGPAPTREEFDALTKRVDVLEDQVRSMVEAISGQPATARRILADRINERLKSGKTVAKGKVLTAKTSKPITYNAGYAVTAVVGTRAWIRPVSQTDARDLCVAKGDEFADSRVVEVNTLGKYVVLANGEHIH